MSSWEKDSKIPGVNRGIDVWDDVVVGGLVPCGELLARGDSCSERMQPESDQLGFRIKSSNSRKIWASKVESLDIILYLISSQKNKLKC